MVDLELEIETCHCHHLNPGTIINHYKSACEQMSAPPIIELHYLSTYSLYEENIQGIGVRNHHQRSVILISQKMFISYFILYKLSLIKMFSFT